MMPPTVDTPLHDLRVLVVAGDPLARAGLAALLREAGGLQVVGEVAEADLEVEVDRLRPDLLLWDLGWDPEAELAALADLAETGPPLLALAPDPATARAARLAGAHGVLPREIDAEALTAALRALAHGLLVLHPDLTAPTPRPDDLPAALEPLTPREQEVLALLAEGLSNRAIAHRLGISEHTVKFHVNAILGKLGAASRTEAVVRAARLGLLPL